MVLIDALVVKVRDGQVTDKSFYIVIVVTYADKRNIRRLATGSWGHPDAVTRRGAVKARIQTINQLKALLVNASTEAGKDCRGSRPRPWSRPAHSCVPPARWPIGTDRATHAAPVPIPDHRDPPGRHRAAWSPPPPPGWSDNYRTTGQAR